MSHHPPQHNHNKEVRVHQPPQDFGGDPRFALVQSGEWIHRDTLIALIETICAMLFIVVCTNLACVTDDILLYFRDEGVKVSTSLDGPAFLHNKNRPRPGHNSYEKAIEGIERSRAILGVESVAALMTTTAASLDYAAEIVDEYVRREFHSIFLRPISPYGFAVKTRHRTGYEMDRFLEFYKQGLAHILKVNRGGYRIAEVYTQILLTKMLTPHSTRYVDMQSPRVR